ncbi:prolyl aminopeptidase [Pseudoclavibacter sp. 13-3]|uniref:prolyl aminopeptidase n=1 Tax=Pseudoclavibacter sp. 13-3 TaxID=2901228 RepID=UPI001E633694|nr:prolyl aminopeptidase [Pseudoclavibacter sp. 13-3]MCD7101053.1 prolyl aminopeptidase [Pseudoclavibacter sp. 13-3]
MPDTTTASVAAHSPAIETRSLDEILYPALEPYQTEHLDVGEGQRLYVEQSGNPHGTPVVFVHGGPGGGTSPWQRRFFDPAVYRIILFDQRGCGRSTPHAADGADLSVIDTARLVADMECIRERLGVERWLVFGGSWGSTLSLAYAEAHPEHVIGLVLRGIFLLRRWELDWYYNRGGAQNLFPDLFDAYESVLREHAPDELAGDHIETFHRLLNGSDPEVALRAALAWSAWEARTSHLLIPDEPVQASQQLAEHRRFALAFARIENHFFANAGFMRENQLIDEADRLGGIPGVIVQGRYDVVCPPRSAWELHRAWPQSQLTFVPNAGHGSNEAGIAAGLIEATDAFRALR